MSQHQVVRLPQALGERIDIHPTVASLRPLILESIDRVDHDRRLPTELVDALWDAGIFKTIHPRELGGLELHPLDQLDLVFELARLSGSVAWIAHFQNGSLPLLPVAAMEELSTLAGGRSIFAGSHAKLGQAVRVEGGYRFTGKYVFASGAPYATYMTAYATIIGEDGEPEIDPITGAPAVIDGMVPSAQVTMVDDWHTLGLRGSSSNGFEVDDVFVPERFTTNGWPDEAYADRPILSELWESPLAMIYLGIVQGAIDRFIALSSRPRRVDHSKDQIHRVPLAAAAAMVASTREWLGATTVRQLTPAPQADPEEQGLNKTTILSDDMSMADMLPLVEGMQALVYSGRIAKRAMNLVFDMAGSDSVHSSKGIERCLRDLYTGTQHTGAHQRNLAMRGEYLLTKDRPEGPSITFPDSLS
jgi:alkylation response protein AidB-like acyl-CoA dehydrogenase